MSNWFRNSANWRGWVDYTGEDASGYADRGWVDYPAWDAAPAVAGAADAQPARVDTQPPLAKARPTLGEPQPPPPVPLASFPMPGPPPVPKSGKAPPPECPNLQEGPCPSADARTPMPKRPVPGGGVTHRLQTADTEMHTIAKPSYGCEGIGTAAFAKAPEPAVAGSDRGDTGARGSTEVQAAVTFSTGAQMLLTTDDDDDDDKDNPKKPTIYDVAFFQNHPLAHQGHIRDHNASLKYFRDVLEPKNTSWTPQTAHLFDSTVINLEDAMWTRMVVHATEGAAFGFDMSDDGVTTYHGATLLAHLTAASLNYAVNGPQGRSGGLVKITVEARPNSYDHNRCAQTGGQIRLPNWDYVLHRADRSVLRMHPARQGIKISCLEGAVAPAVTPKSGLGKSDGKGSYQRQLRAQTNKTLHFRHPL